MVSILQFQISTSHISWCSAFSHIDYTRAHALTLMRRHDLAVGVYGRLFDKCEEGERQQHATYVQEYVQAIEVRLIDCLIDK